MLGNLTKLQNELDHNRPLWVSALLCRTKEAEGTDHSLGLLGWTGLLAASNIICGEGVLQIGVILMAYIHHIKETKPRG